MKSQNPSMSDLAAELAPIAAALKHPAPFFLAGGCAMWAGAHWGQSPAPTIAYTLFAYILALLAVIDLKHGILPHLLTGLLAILGTLLAPTLGLTYWQSTLGALVAFAGLFACALVTEKLTGKQSLGGGDLWLTLGLGAWLGLAGLPMLLLATAVTGTVSVLVRRWINGGFPSPTGETTFAFGPALCAAGWLALLYGAAYWKFIAMLTAPAS